MFLHIKATSTRLLFKTDHCFYVHIGHPLYSGVWGNSTGHVLVWRMTRWIEWRSHPHPLPDWFSSVMTHRSAKNAKTLETTLVSNIFTFTFIWFFLTAAFTTLLTHICLLSVAAGQLYSFYKCHFCYIWTLLLTYLCVITASNPRTDLSHTSRAKWTTQPATSKQDVCSMFHILTRW